MTNDTTGGARPAPAQSAGQEMTETERKNARLAAFSGFFGSTIEYFDFVCFASASALVFNHVFFGAWGGKTGTIASLATFGVAYVARPLGAIIFGTLGDRIGRTRTLVYTLVLMGAATFLIGCLPTPDVIGVWAPILLVFLRILQGLSAGGEQAGSNSLTSEKAPKEKRGLFTGWTMIGVAFGTTLGSAVFIPLAANPEFLHSWGWRLPFLAAGPLAFFALWIRKHVEEPQAFVAVQQDIAAGKPAAQSVPLVGLIRVHWKNLLRVIFCSLFALAGSLGNVFFVTYATNYTSIEVPRYLTLLTILGLVTIPVALGWAVLSDKIGRRPIFIGSVIGMGVLVPMIFVGMQSNSWLLIIVGMAFFQCLAAGGNIVQAPLYTEMFPTSVRYTGYAVGTQVGLLLVGFAPAIMAGMVKPGAWGWVPVAVFAAVCWLAAAIAAFTARETRGMSVSEIDNAMTR